MARCVQARGDGRLIDVVGLHALAHQPAHRVDDLRAAAVVEGERHDAVRARGRRLHRLGDGALQARCELVQPADDLEAHVVLHERVRLAPDRLLEERHEPAHFFGLA